MGPCPQISLCILDVVKISPVISPDKLYYQMVQIRYGSLTDVVSGNYSPIDCWSRGGAAVDFLSFTCSHFLPNNVMNLSKATIRWNLRIPYTYASFQAPQFMNINRDPKISDFTAFPWHHSSPEVVAAVVRVTF